MFASFSNFVDPVDDDIPDLIVFVRCLADVSAT